MSDQQQFRVGDRVRVRRNPKAVGVIVHVWDPPYPGGKTPIYKVRFGRLTARHYEACEIMHVPSEEQKP